VTKWNEKFENIRRQFHEEGRHTENIQRQPETECQ
jgi:hypothetical protein